jgi:hypothetical protein
MRHDKRFVPVIRPNVDRATGEYKGASWVVYDTEEDRTRTEEGLRPLQDATARAEALNEVSARRKAELAEHIRPALTDIYLSHPPFCDCVSCDAMDDALGEIWGGK